MEDTNIKEGSPVIGEPSPKDENIPPIEGEENPPAEGEEENTFSINTEIQKLIENELSKFKSQFASTIEEYKNNSKSLAEEKHKLEIEKLLTESEILDGRSYDFIYSDDIELVKSKIENLENLINESINERVDLIINQRLRESSWIPGNNSNTPAFKSSNIKSNLSYVKDR
ncbi:MAG: hypothetical protein E6303_01525 [Clostridium perfringens]|uniref:hypothetical protein n=1 Tax=Clostridium perfringens TaxID=1502 RepID=UPI001157893F|nr:hypothetical protein [Clostridium perfringens]MDU7109485.1 hypothetical protein [Clostridium perfringens]